MLCPRATAGTAFVRWKQAGGGWPGGGGLGGLTGAEVLSTRMHTTYALVPALTVPFFSSICGMLL